MLFTTNTISTLVIKTTTLITRAVTARRPLLPTHITLGLGKTRECSSTGSSSSNGNRLLVGNSSVLRVSNKNFIKQHHQRHYYHHHQQQQQQQQQQRVATIMTTTASSSLPSTMTGPPVGGPIVPPGQCQFGADEFVSVPLLARTPVSATTSVLRFGLPDSSKPLNLSTCACILAMTKIKDETVIRPYTPISTNSDIGYFDLLVKDYPDHEAMSKYLCETVTVGSNDISFKHIPFNVKIQYNDEIKDLDFVGMLVGGTGVTPMIQALHAIVGNAASASESGTKKPTVTMLYGSRVSTDILGNEILKRWSDEQPDVFKLVDILSHEPTDSDWKGERGFIDRNMIEKYFPAPESDKKFKIFICGPPPMYNALSGPRDVTEKVSGLLGDMGYKPEQIFKF